MGSGVGYNKVMSSSSSDIDFLEQQINLACWLEATARKPGNVHPGQSFVDLDYGDFIQSAEAVAPILADANRCGVGRAILNATQKTRDIVRRNTNLGIVLLMAPLSAVPVGQRLTEGIGHVLAELDQGGLSDVDFVFEAIRVAQPGGMGTVKDQDVCAPPSKSLVECMSLAADRDTIARQYTDGFEQVLTAAASLAGYWQESRWEQSIIRLYLSLLSTTPDTLIQRKCGANAAREVSDQAADVLSNLPQTFDARHPALLNFDSKLRLDGHRLNPGTTADMVAAILFAALRERTIVWTGKIDLASAVNTFAGKFTNNFVQNANQISDTE